MRLFAGFTLLALGLFWSYPFLPPAIERTVRAKVASSKVASSELAFSELASWPAPREPILVLAPKGIRVQPGETAAVSLAENALTESSADPRR
ncbi:hypothetical protein [Microvirga sp. M2]|uniref:hypothetical protein n=1 Tax=Microvirga sp. M2 TaxID=3073270 RepID=UPI0039C0A739